MGGGGGAPPDGIGGGGGAPLPGIGGGGGAPPLGIGGGGGAPLDGIGGGGGGADGLACAGEAGVEPDPVFMLDSGRGGAIVPNKIDARCLALPPPGRPPSFSSSSDDDDESSTTDQSSSSLGAARVRAGAAEGSGRLVMAPAVPPMRWKGFVDAPASAGRGGAAGAEGVDGVAALEGTAG
ncbi:hypothetical protein ANO11243_068440 [Dothideomycetidae sp. 11243]|nr:hypothetical protein ANO11243_068440 [fungal sp. No.11243]